MTNASAPSLFRRFAGWTLVAVAVILGIPVAAVSFFLAAGLGAPIPLATAGGMAATVALCGALNALGARLALRRRRGLAAGVATGCVALAVTVASVLTVFRPLDYKPVPLPPQATRYWQLPTGSRIAYTYTPGTGRRAPFPVVRLHGGPGTPGAGPDDLDRELAARGFDVYTYDQLGSGRSQRLSDPAGYTVARQLADLEAIRRRVNAARLILVGSSWGRPSPRTTWPRIRARWRRPCSPPPARSGPPNGRRRARVTSGTGSRPGSASAWTSWRRAPA
ncbi:alpha/beta fold hydrolase [Actinomadura yumaensis]|uniref:alpha/beta fold hydrolase n=1 Tax=Actinomadura TaxID=1988 RepID=UPI0013277E04|nr:alpha/beta fold hydrolase [Actinomadura sp. J1-007]MWK40621.1 alpha/beta fold hydrolase [Actinomadura sp. J1-007]